MFQNVMGPGSRGLSKADSDGIMVNDKTSEQHKAMITDVPIVPTNSPDGPGMLAIGRNDRIVVIVLPNSGNAMCETPCLTASNRDSPSRKRRWTSSTMMMAVPSSIPSAITKPLIDI